MAIAHRGVRPAALFVDVQLRGPYRRWEHRHTFRAVDGGTQITDEVEYELPFGPLGDLVHRLVVRNQLRHIFDYRAAVLATALQAPEDAPTGRFVAVAGGTGFVGGAIASGLHRRGHRVVVLSHRGEAARGSLADAIEIRSADVSEPGTIAPALADVDGLVIALAFPNSPMESPRKGHTFEAVDAEGTGRLVRAAVGTGVRRLVYISGAGAAPDAERHWFRAKWRAEQSVRGSGILFTIIRPTWIYGPRDVSLNRFITFARFLPVVPMTNAGQQRLAPVFVDDAADLAADALDDPAAVDRVLELGGPETLTMRDIIGRALRIAGLRPPILPGLTPLLKLAAGADVVAADPATNTRGHRFHQPAGDGGSRAVVDQDAPAPSRAGRGATELPAARNGRTTDAGDRRPGRRHEPHAIAEAMWDQIDGVTSGAGADVAIVSFGRDLRLHDNPALTAALASSGRVAATRCGRWCRHRPRSRA